MCRSMVGLTRCYKTSVFLHSQTHAETNIRIEIDFFVLNEKNVQISYFKIEICSVLNVCLTYTLTFQQKERQRERESAREQKEWKTT